MTREELENRLLEGLDDHFFRNIPGREEGLTFFVDLEAKKKRLFHIPEHEAFCADVRAWIGGGKFPDDVVMYTIGPLQEAVNKGLKESGETRDLALRILKDISGLKVFDPLRVNLEDFKAIGWDFKQCLTASLKSKMEYSSEPESFGRAAAKAFPDEAEDWAKQTLKNPRDDTNSRWLRALYCAIYFLIIDAKKYAHFQEAVDKAVRETYDGLLANKKDEHKYYTLKHMCFECRRASPEILKILREIVEKKLGILGQGRKAEGAEQWDPIIAELGLPDYTVPVMVIQGLAYPAKDDDGYLSEAEYFNQLLKTRPDCFFGTYKKLLEEKSPYLLRLLKIAHVGCAAGNDTAGAELAALNKAEPNSQAEALWKFMEEYFVNGRGMGYYMSTVAAADICPRALAICASVIEAERQKKKKKLDNYYNPMVSLYFSGREESWFGEKPGIILDELVSNKILGSLEFFSLYHDLKNTNYKMPPEALKYAISKYPADAEAFTATVGKALETDACLEWLDLCEGKLPVLAFVPVLNSTPKKIVDRVEKLILAAPALDRAAIIEAVSVVLPKLKKNGEAAAERILVLLKSKK